MSDRAFVDTNVLVYAHDTASGPKHRRATELVENLWSTRGGVVSTQVLQELYVNLRRRVRTPLPLDEARRLIGDYLRWEVVVNTGESIVEALEIEDRYGLSFWDSLIVQAATRSGVERLYSEDLGHGQLYGTVRVVNPFAEKP
ncbi:MAG TPA: PIN domain-containing protein [Vicinamibacteria bacterium]|nr:PIN domain-containing protein [Vicinamibacteria bacterium]